MHRTLDGAEPRTWHDKLRLARSRRDRTRRQKSNWLPYAKRSTKAAICSGISPIRLGLQSIAVVSQSGSLRRRS